MAIPTTTMTVVEIIAQGVAAAAGSAAKNVFNVYHFRRNSNVPPLVKSHIESQFQTSIMGPVLAALNIRYTQTQTSVRVVNDPLDQAVNFTETVAGAITGDSMASFDTAFLLFQTGIKGKRYRGNKKFGPMSESDSTTTSDIFNSNCLTRLAAIASAIMAGFTDSDGNLWKPVLFSRLNQLTVTLPTVACADLTAIKVNKRIGRLRRREVKSVY